GRDACSAAPSRARRNSTPPSPGQRDAPSAKGCSRASSGLSRLALIAAFYGFAGAPRRGWSEIPPTASGLRIEPEHAQFLVATAGRGDARGPRDGLLAGGQFEHGEAAIERRRPRIAALRGRAGGRDEHGRHTVVDATAEDV